MEGSQRVVSIHCQSSFTSAQQQILTSKESYVRGPFLQSSDLDSCLESGAKDTSSSDSSDATP